MADALDHLARPAGHLLARVDDLLSRFGAADDDPVWPLLRRVRALPGEAVAALASTLRAEPIAAAGVAVRARTTTYDEARVAVTAPVVWEGPAGDAFSAHAARLAAELTTATDALAATARLADEVADWATRTRARLAAVLAEVLTSGEAVAVVLGTNDAARAAVTIATRVLTALDAASTDAETIPRPAHGRRPAAGASPPASYERITRLSC
ncbi:hypothetical protein Ais01nite_34990 [Asanoa ishikariensis]|uniref:Uncharacterized protein n=1 Tax=Asanoa ishikariensis TaxID=137265 RepID=A0A1H3LGK5_9ACTN|nr:hypothetical protein [Asanoa ishikariensis]GIF65464.1 hypothetical protein Ais01nite_34990 [Asanoa ishikariensis]SDY63440.1 hypothetical protein SAMN05421684_0740 [Asanoa ishikariensis]